MESRYPTHLFGPALKLVRMRSGKTLEYVAAMVGLSSGNTVSSFERGKHDMHMSTFFLILEALEVSVRDLLDICKNELGWKPPKRKQPVGEKQ